jgi:hypothetical protein
MPRSHDRDAHLEWLRQELRTTLTQLNQLHHPVYPAPAERIEAVESYVAELKESIRLRKDELRAELSAQSAQHEPAETGTATS